MAGPFKMKGSPMQRNFGVGSPLYQDKNPKVDVGSKKRVVGDIYTDAYAAEYNPESVSYTDEYAQQVKKDMLSNKNLSKSDRELYEKQKEIIQTYRHQQRNLRLGEDTLDESVI